MKLQSLTQSSLGNGSGLNNKFATGMDCSTWDTPVGSRRPSSLVKASALSKTQEQQNDPLLIKADEACRILGGITKRTLDRLCQRGLIKPVPFIRHKTYALADVQSLVQQLRSWEA
jgi:hypothetical protein